MSRKTRTFALSRFGAVAGSSSSPTVTKNTNALARAIEEASADGGVIEIPEGEFSIHPYDVLSAPLRILASGVSLSGAGSHKSTIRFPTWEPYGGSGVNNSMILVGTNDSEISDVVISGLGFVGDSDYQVLDESTYGPMALVQFGIANINPDVSRVISCGIEKCFFRGIGGACVSVNGGTLALPSWGTFIKGCWFQDCPWTAITNSGSIHQDAQIIGNWTKNTGGFGIQWSYPAVNIANNNFRNCCSGAINATWGLVADAPAFIVGNQIHGCGNAIDAPTAAGAAILLGENAGVNRVVVANNLITDSYGSGITQASPLSNAWVINNYVIGFGVEAGLGGGLRKDSGVLGLVGIGLAGDNIVVAHNYVHGEHEGTDLGDTCCDYSYSIGGDDSSDVYAINNIDTGNFRGGTSGAGNGTEMALGVSFGAAGGGTRLHPVGNYSAKRSAYALPLNEPEGTYLPPALVDVTNSPDVTGVHGVLRIAQSSPQSWTTIVGGEDNQQLILLFQEANTELQHNTGNIRTRSGSNVTPGANTTFTLVRSNGIWYEV